MRIILWIATAVLALVGVILAFTVVWLWQGINLLITSMMTAFGASVLQLLERIAQSGETQRLEAPLHTPPTAGPSITAAGSNDTEESDLAQKIKATWEARGTPGTMLEARNEARITISERRLSRR